MLQVLLAGLRSYAPWITLPFAIVVGAVGFTVERTIHGGKAEPVRLKSVAEERDERRLAESVDQDCTNVASLKEKKGIPKSVLDRNELKRQSEIHNRQSVVNLSRHCEVEDSQTLEKLSSSSAYKLNIDVSQASLACPRGHPSPTRSIDILHWLLKEQHRKMDVRLSKLLSRVLRHKAVELGFNIYPGGYILVKDLLAHRMVKRFTEADIRRVVASNDKQRFSLKTSSDTGELMICANQGHSFEFPEPELEPIKDASRFPTVVHGTYFRFWDLIHRQGLKRMNRNHIHFAQGEPGGDGVISGMRRSCQVMIFIDLAAALRDGIHFFLAKNGVILSPGNADGILRTRYFSRVIEVHSRKPIPFEKH